mmetsp:Transcript_19722/g.49552  ORF Transcript_19722/g.49552 Transcript_19722/m.49552 type:complete len:303 (-) Transcript_19722:2341-3249(-)
MRAAAEVARSRSAPRKSLFSSNLLTSTSADIGLEFAVFSTTSGGVFSVLAVTWPFLLLPAKGEKRVLWGARSADAAEHTTNSHSATRTKLLEGCGNSTSSSKFLNPPSARGARSRRPSDTSTASGVTSGFFRRSSSSIFSISSLFIIFLPGEAEAGSTSVRALLKTPTPKSAAASSATTGSTASPLLLPVVEDDAASSVTRPAPVASPSARGAPGASAKTTLLEEDATAPPCVSSEPSSLKYLASPSSSRYLSRWYNALEVVVDGSLRAAPPSSVRAKKVAGAVLLNGESGGSLSVAPPGGP